MQSKKCARQISVGAAIAMVGVVATRRLAKLLSELS